MRSFIARRRLLIAIVLSLCPVVPSIPVQTLSQGFEKRGRFVVPGQGLSLEKNQGPAFEGMQPFDVLHYKLDLTLAMLTEDFSGKSAITMRLKSTADTVVLNATLLQLDTVRVDGSIKAIRLNQTETFTIFLGNTRNAGDTLRIEISYRRLPSVIRPSSRRGYYHFLVDSLPGLPANLGYTMSEPSDARLWMPCYDEPWEKATAEMNITVPAAYVAGSNGKLVAVRNNGNGTLTWSWREDHQIATYLMCVTVSEFAISTIPYVKATGETMPVQYYTWRRDSSECAAYLPTVRNMMEVYESLFGTYPFDKYGMTTIGPFNFGGMEHQTLTTLNVFLRTDEQVVVHELAHEWWGDLVTCGTWADIWLNESFATYSEALWQERIGGPDSLRSYMKNTLENFNNGSWLQAVYNPVGQGENLFSDLVYGKGAWVLHTLRGVVGDSLFFRILRSYRQKYEGKSAVTAEFQAVVDSVAGHDMSWFFNEWIYGKGWPQYLVNYTWADDLLSVKVDQTQSSSWPVFRMPMAIRAYHGAGSSTTFMVLDSLRTQTFKLALPFVPESVVVDPDRWILKQITTSTASSGSGQIALSYKLQQNYPNPFNGGTNIEYTVPSRQDVSVRVFDVLGREVSTLVSANQRAGKYVVRFDGSTVASGVYIYRLQVGNTFLTKKMLLLK